MEDQEANHHETEEYNVYGDNDLMEGKEIIFQAFINKNYIASKENRKTHMENNQEGAKNEEDDKTHFQKENKLLRKIQQNKRILDISPFPLHYY